MRKFFFFAILCMLLHVQAWTQPWKQDLDSAVFHNSKKNIDKAIEFYIKLKDDFKRDSGLTLFYAGICDSIGDIYVAKRKSKNAEEEYIEANQVREKLIGKENSDYAATSLMLGTLYKDLGQYSKAEPWLIESRNIRAKLFGIEDKRYGSSTYWLANLNMMMGQYPKAENLFKEALDIRKIVFGKEHIEYANALASLGQVYRLMGQYQKAEPMMLESKDIIVKIGGKENDDYSKISNLIAILYINMQLFDKAIVYLKESRDIREKLYGNQSSQYASVINSLGVAYFQLGQVLKAEEFLNEMMTIYEKNVGRKHPDYLRSINNLGVLYSGIGMYEKALPLLIEAKIGRGEILGFNHDDYAVTCRALGVLYRNMANYELAEKYLVESKERLEKAQVVNNQELAGSIGDLAYFFALIGQYDKELALRLQGRDLQEKASGKSSLYYASSCSNLALFYRRIKDYDKAEALYMETKDILEKAYGKDNSSYAGLCRLMGSLYMEREQYDKAEKLLMEAKQIMEKLLGEKYIVSTLETINHLAILYSKIGRFAESEKLFQQMKTVQEGRVGKLHPEYAQFCDDLANYYTLVKAPLLSDSLFKESFSINEYNLEKIFLFTNEKEKNAYVKKRTNENDKIYSFYLNSRLKSDLPYSLSLFQRNLILSSSQSLKKQLQTLKDTAIINKYNEWISLKNYLSLLYSKPIGERKEDLKSIEESAGLLEKQLTRFSGSFMDSSANASWKSVQKSLKSNETAIEFTEFNYYDGTRFTDSIYYIALLLKKEVKLPELVYMFEKKQLDSVLNYQNASAGRVKLNYLYNAKPGEKGKTIYDLVWKPLESKLAGIKTVYFAPAGLLHKISFAALYVNGKQQLSDKYRIIQLSTTALISDKKQFQLQPDEKLVMYGGVQYNSDSSSMAQAVRKYQQMDLVTRSLPEDLDREGVAEFNYLEGTESEVKSVSELAEQNHFNVRVYRGLEATEESFKFITAANSPGLLHIATHGFFFPDPKYKKADIHDSGVSIFKLSENPLIRSGLALAGANNAWKGKRFEGVEDGILTSYEVSNMFFPNTKLAVLSACETGLGDIQGSEGVYGLQRAFKLAGVQNLIMSLWKVPDVETAEFMLEFYKNLFLNQTISDAFVAAQTIMKNKYRDQPYKWAAWILVR